MIDLTTWKLVTDVMLCAVLGFFAFRMLRSPDHAASMQGSRLARDLRSLIDEARSVERGLGEELTRRRRVVEELLQEARQAEQRLQRAQSMARNAPAPSSMSIGGGMVSGARDPEPPSFERSKVVAESQSVQPSVGAARPSRVNIYGEPIEDSPSGPPPAAARRTSSRSKLNDAVEREIVPSRPVKTGNMQAYSTAHETAISMAPIYSAAEDLLRAGKDLDYVAAKTRMPIEEVRMLARMVTQEQKVQMPEDVGQAPSVDPRLGVLGAAKRQVEAL